jgi:hypothetical protein
MAKYFARNVYCQYKIVVNTRSTGMKTTRILSVAIVIGVTVAAAQQASAQLVNIYSSPGWVNTIASIQESQIVKNALGNTKNKTGSSSVSKSTSSSQSEPYVVPAYRRYPAVQFKSTGTRLTLQEYLDSLPIGAQDKPEAKEFILKTFKEYETEAAAKGYPNDWALAFVSYVSLNSRIYHGITEKPILPFEQNIGMRDVVAEYVTDNGIFNNVTDRQKQELYELLVIGGALTYQVYEKALKENDTEQLKNLKLMAVQQLKVVGIKP